MRLMLLALAFSLGANARTVAGVSVPESATVGGQTLALNGAGLREKYFIDIYVGALYLPTPTRVAQEAIDSDVPKRVVMHFIYAVPKDDLAATLQESLALSPDAAVAMKSYPTFAGWMEDVGPGDQIVLDYVPGVGTTVTVKGKKKGTIAGVEFMRAIWGIYLGPTPPSASLKKGMLGG